MIRRRLSRAVALVLMPLVSAGCYGWRVTDIPPRTVVETQRPSQIRVTTGDRTRVEIVSPRIAGDSLVGRARWGDRRAVGIAVADVTRTETYQLKVAPTAVAIVLAAGVVAAFIALGTMTGPTFSLGY